MKTSKGKILIVAIFLFSLLLTACGGQDMTDASPTTPTIEQTLEPTLEPTSTPEKELETLGVASAKALRMQRC